MTRTRRNVWLEDASAPFGPTTSAYATAVDAMRARPDDDPRSWTAQAAMHGTARLVPGARQNLCQHSSWFFLPWHRLYLHYFEDIARQAIIDAGGPADWALPYWNYELGGAQASLPLAFRSPQRPDGSPNPLHTAARGDRMNTGAPLTRRQASSAQAMSMTDFAGPAGTSFGGGVSDPAQFSRFRGELEQQPHNAIHVLVGGGAGWMSDPMTAALDPIFWVHHANIDRLWDRWLARGQGRTNPSDPRWRDTEFVFYDRSGNEVRRSAADVVDDARSLGYVYDDALPPVTAALRARQAVGGSAPPVPPGPPEVLAAVDTGVELTGRAEVAVPLDGDAARRIDSIVGDPASGARVLLNLNGVETPSSPGVVYEIHLDLPDDADPDTDDSYFVGILSFVDALPGTAPTVGPDDGTGSASGVSESYDITGLVDLLRRQGRWDSEQVRVTFVPAVPGPVEGTALTSQDRTPAAPATVAQVSIRST